MQKKLEIVFCFENCPDLLREKIDLVIKTANVCKFKAEGQEFLKNEITKGGFFSESAIRFSNLPIFKKKYSKKLSSAWNLNLLFTVIGGKFKFKFQDSFLEYFYFGDLEI